MSMDLEKMRSDYNPIKRGYLSLEKFEKLKNDLEKLSKDRKKLEMD